MNKHCTVKNAPEPSALKAPYAMDPPPLTPVTSPYAIAQGTAAPLPVGPTIRAKGTVKAPQLAPMSRTVIPGWITWAKSCVSPSENSP